VTAAKVIAAEMTTDEMSVITGTTAEVADMKAKTVGIAETTTGADHVLRGVMNEIFNEVIIEDPLIWEVQFYFIYTNNQQAVDMAGVVVKDSEAAFEAATAIAEVAKTVV
jgi:hypothetical protein